MDKNIHTPNLPLEAWWFHYAPYYEL